MTVCPDLRSGFADGSPKIRFLSEPVLLRFLGDDPLDGLFVIDVYDDRGYRSSLADIQKTDRNFVQNTAKHRLNA